MELTILGSGGATPTPRPFCQCAVCKRARTQGEPFKRNSSALYIDDIFTLIDCGEDIADALNRRNVWRVDNLFITHWHPDHTFGLRPLLEANFDFTTAKTEKRINVYIPKRVYETLRKKYPTIEYLLYTQRTGKLIIVEHDDVIKLGKISITVVGYKGKKSDTYAYLIESNGKRVLYAPCDTIDFEQKHFDLDVLVNECGLFSEQVKTEISFTALMKRISNLRPKRTILTHIEESELNNWGWNYLAKMKKQYSDVNFDFAYDGMKIKI